MLSRLTVKNFALLRDTEIILDSGFTAITGETGSGKSLLVNAISFLVGGKIATGVVRDGAQTAVVEGEFIFPAVNHGGLTAGKVAVDPPRLTASSDSERTVIIRRELSFNGRSRAFIQDSPVTIKQLSQLTSTLIDITAQRAFSHLLEPTRHLDFLDQFAGLYDERTKMTEYAGRYSSLERRLKNLTRKQKEFQQRQDLISFQLSEINAVDPQPGEDEQLRADVRRLEHFEEFHNNAQQFEYLISSSNTAVVTIIIEASQLLNNLADIDPELAALTDEFSTAGDTVKEIANQVSERRRRMIFETGKLESLRERQHQLSGITRKYGGNLSEALNRKAKLESELSSSYENRREITGLEEKKQKLLKEWNDLAQKVSKKRNIAAKKLQKSVIRSLEDLGVKDACFEVRFIQIPVCERGIETVEFYLSTNPGIEPKPLVQVASGGELSRLLLAIKEAIPAADNEAAVIFDEIDTGVSGRIARLVGKKLKKLSSVRQLIAITHLPQIAGLADNHYKILKAPDKQGTVSEIKELDENGRIQELAMLLSGGKVTDAALEQAENLMK
ncbi:MAG: DNA repair protein RecN [Candidatus Hatepunaea meridiana]|nr:DNA repair protein RecN [Candidatus Hatepunaea meridiana]